MKHINYQDERDQHFSIIFHQTSWYTFTYEIAAQINVGKIQSVAKTSDTTTSTHNHHIIIIIIKRNNNNNCLSYLVFHLIHSYAINLRSISTKMMHFVCTFLIICLHKRTKINTQKKTKHHDFNAKKLRSRSCGSFTQMRLNQKK